MLTHSNYIRVLIAILALIPLIAPSVGSSSLLVAPETYKVAVSLLGIGVLFLLWVLRGWRKGLIIRKTPFYYPVLGFIIWSFISLIWVVDSYMAIIQLVQFVSVALLFFLIINSVASEKEVGSLLIFIVMTAFLVAIIGLLQFYYPDSNEIQTFYRQHTRPAASFGNKNMAVHFIVMTLPLSVVFLLISDSRKKFILFFISFVIIVWFLVISFTRAGWVAAFVQMCFIGAFILYDTYKSVKISSAENVGGFKKRHIILPLLLILLCASFFVVKSSNTSSIKVFKQVNSVIQEIRTFDNGRVPAWLNTIELIKERPLIGVGVNQWSTYYPLYYDRVAKDTSFTDYTRLRNVHNDYLELLANHGIIGFSFLIWLFLTTSYFGLKLLASASKRTRYLSLGLLSGLLGFAVEAFFTFPIKVYYPMLLALVFIALIANISLRSSLDEGIVHRIVEREQKNVFSINKASLFITLIGSICLVVVASTVIYKWVLGEHYFNIAQQVKTFYQFSNVGDDKLISERKARLRQIDKSIKYNPYNPTVLSYAGSIYLENNLFGKAASYFEKSLERSPNQSLVFASLAKSYFYLKDESNLLLTLDRWIAIDPKSVKASAMLANYYLSNKDEVQAKRWFVEMKKNHSYFNGRNEYGPYFTIVGRTAHAFGDYSFAKSVYSDAIDNYDAKHHANFQRYNSKHKMLAIYHRFLGLLYFYYSSTHEEKLQGINFIKIAMKLDPDIDKREELRLLVSKFTESQIYDY